MKQRTPKTIEAAVGATTELESYLVRAKHGVVALVQVEPKDTLLEIKLTVRVNKLESLRLHI